MKQKYFYLIFCIFVFFIFSACSLQKNAKITTSEYTKEVVVQNTKFNSSLDQVLDQIETYNGSESSKERLNRLIDDTLAIINYIKNDLGPKVPSENYSHYESMLKAYDLYKEGLELYKNNIPAPLSDERKQNIQLAENKFEEAKSALKNLK